MKEMKKIYYVYTNGYDMVVTISSENEVKYLTENDYFPAISWGQDDYEKRALEFLETQVEDDSFFETGMTYEDFWGLVYEGYNSGNFVIIAEIEKEIYTHEPFTDIWLKTSSSLQRHADRLKKEKQED